MAQVFLPILLIRLRETPRDGQRRPEVESLREVQIQPYLPCHRISESQVDGISLVVGVEGILVRERKGCSSRTRPLVDVQKMRQYYFSQSRALHYRL